MHTADNIDGKVTIVRRCPSFVRKVHRLDPPLSMTVHVDVGRNLWICDIHGSACAIYGSILCAEIHGLRRYLWIAQGSCLRGPREIFAGPPAILSHTCLLCNFSCNISGQFALYVWSTTPHVSVRCEAEVRNNSNITRRYLP